MFNKTASTPTTPTTGNPASSNPGDAAPRPAAPSYPAASDAAQQRRTSPPARTPSLLGPDLLFEGSITGDGELHVEGSVRGEVQVARLLIGERAQVEGAVRGQHIEVRGRVAGNIEAKMVKLYESAHVEGDIVHEQLSIDVGAYFTGRCQVMKRAAPQPVAAPAPTAKAEEPAAPTAAAAKPANGAAGSKVIELDKSPSAAAAN